MGSARAGRARRAASGSPAPAGQSKAAEFLDNPFTGPFGKIMAALSERNSCRGWLKQEVYKNDASIPKRLEAALKALVPVPVKHEIKIEPVT